MVARTDFEGNADIKFIIMGDSGEYIHPYVPEAGQRVVVIGYTNNGKGDFSGTGSEMDYRSIDMVCVEHGNGYKGCDLEGSVRRGAAFFIDGDKKKMNAWLDGLEDIKVISPEEKEKAKKDLGLMGPGHAKRAAGIA